MKNNHRHKPGSHWCRPRHQMHSWTSYRWPGPSSRSAGGWRRSFATPCSPQTASGSAGSAPQAKQKNILRCRKHKLFHEWLNVNLCMWESWYTTDGSSVRGWTLPFKSRTVGHLKEEHASSIIWYKLQRKLRQYHSNSQSPETIGHLSLHLVLTPLQVPCTPLCCLLNLSNLKRTNDNI